MPAAQPGNYPPADVFAGVEMRDLECEEEHVHGNQGIMDIGCPVPHLWV